MLYVSRKTNYNQIEQLSLFEMGTQGDPASRERLEKLEDAVLGIRKKHGSKSIGMGYAKNDEIGLG